MTKQVLVAGAGGFIGGHLAARLIALGHKVRAVDIKPRNAWWQWHPEAVNVDRLDLRSESGCVHAVDGCEEVYNLACNMGGMGFIERNKTACMLSVLINTHLLREAEESGVKRYFFASSACVYPAYRQSQTDVTPLKESNVYPADAEDGYGWEKLFGERLCRHFQEETRIVTRVARLHNVFGPLGTWTGGREKAPAALCRKVIDAGPGGTIEVWGDGGQTRSFLFIDECIEGILRIMRHGGDAYLQPLNLGSDRLISINELVNQVEIAAGYRVQRRYDPTKPVGVRGRNADNTLICQTLGWAPSGDLETGVATTFRWIDEQMRLPRPTEPQRVG